MNAKKRQRILEGARRYVGDEEVLGAFIAQPRGRTTAVAGAGEPIAREIGHRKVRKQQRAAEDAGIRVEGVMAFVLTPTRLLVLGLGGLRQDVKDELAAIPVHDVTSLEAKRFGLGHKITLAVMGHEILLEGQSGGDVKELAAALERAKTA
ncbi:MAG: hypothetical protein ACR2G3_08825 [Solirubrobacterales bacterium]